MKAKSETRSASEQRAWLCYALVLSSTPLAVALTLAIVFLIIAVTGTRAADAVGFVVFIGNGALGVIGTVAGVMLAPDAGVALRIVLAAAFATASGLAYWAATLVCAVMIFGT